MDTRVYRPVHHYFRPFLILTILVLLLGCGGPGSKMDLRDSSLLAYSGAIRWGHIDDAITMIDPAYLKAHPISTLERERLEQVEFTGYLVKGTQALSEDELMRVVEIRFVNRHTLVERTIQTRELWRWDEANRRWWLNSSLPDITQKSR